VPPNSAQISEIPFLMATHAQRRSALQREDAESIANKAMHNPRRG